MPCYTSSRVRWLSGITAILTGITVGCQDQRPAAESGSVDAPVATSATFAAETDDRFSQSFAQATSDDIGDEQQLPPDVTVAGKATAPIRETVEKLWPNIALLDSAGKPISVVVSLETEEGPIEIALRPALAPNHVRSFIALVRAGYYDGLRFDRVVHQEAVQADGTKLRIDLVKAGCPAGTGDPGVGHIGYHLKPEISDVKHEEGTVGFSRDADANTGGVRFYITLGSAPALDGHYTVVGRVTNGMEVVKKIAAGKLLAPEIDPTRELPERPVVIRKATATTGGLADGGPVTHNK